MRAKTIIESGKAILGIEFGSTRIKAVLIDTDNNPIAQGSFEWENQLVDGLWTYSIDTIWKGLQDCYADLRKNVKAEYDCEIKQLAAIGISAMMHGYMAFGKDENILVPFRTWRNTNTAKAAAELSELFHFNIPLRWSISHVYQAILNGEDHINKIDFLTTLAGYIHWQLTGKRKAIAIAPSYIPKSGHKTPWIGYFWSGCAGDYKRGLEILGIGVIDIDNHECMTLGSIQTPDCKTLDNMGKDLVDWYGNYLISRKDKLQGISRTVVADAFFHNAYV